ncbi:MAG: hypothetical protein OJF50_002436 [Nitrospira sp.]|jgi:hypothetical protein|nr:hypothetical protein [Nitrospira sp.]
MTTHHTCCDACEKIITELLEVLTRCVGLMEMAKIGEMSLYDSHPVHAAKRLLAQAKGLHLTRENLGGGRNVL